MSFGIRHLVAIVLGSMFVVTTVGCSGSSSTPSDSSDTSKSKSSKGSKSGGSGSADDGTNDTSSDTSEDTSPTDPGKSSGPSKSSKKADGAQCKQSADCESDFCVFKSGGSLGMCTKTCEDNIDCGLGEKCVSLGDAPQKACVPE